MTSYRDVFLAHAEVQPYDKAARRERYLRDRQLKGRQPGSQVVPDGGSRQSSAAPANGPRVVPNSTVGKATGSASPITPQRVKEMQARLTQLKELLTKLTEEANRKAGVETPDKKAAAKKAADTAADKPAEKKTAAEKKDAAEAAKKADKKDSKQSVTVDSLQTQLNDVHDKIADMRAKIAAANKAAASKKAPATKPAPKAAPNKPGEDKKPPLKVTPTSGKENRQNGSR